jgi:leucyl-tRNA---protein transferase
MKHTPSLLQYYIPKRLSKASLDRYLAAGWFRTTNMLFRSQVTCFDNDICSPINVRLNVPEHTHGKRMRKLLHKNNELFRYEIQKATITPQIEEMFLQHQARFRSFLCNNLQEFLMLSPHFDTQEIRVYDEDHLVAVSFFDIGREGVMSLLGLFDPRYASYSLGIYTMLLEIEYSKSTNKQWYYPGYVHEVPSIYDYKLRLGNMQVYNWETRRWLRNTHPHQMPNAADRIRKHTHILGTILQKLQLDYQRKVNLFFGWHYYHTMYEGLFRCPLILMLTDGTVVSYDLENRKYLHSELEIYIPFRDIHLQLADDFSRKEHCMDVMKQRKLLFESSNISEFANHLARSYQRVVVSQPSYSRKEPIV